MLWILGALGLGYLLGWVLPPRRAQSAGLVIGTALEALGREGYAEDFVEMVELREALWREVPEGELPQTDGSAKQRAAAAMPLGDPRLVPAWRFARVAAELATKTRDEDLAADVAGQSVGYALVFADYLDAIEGGF